MDLQGTQEFLIVSKDGRAQDAVYDILEGYSTQTEFIEGPMYRHPDLSVTVEKIVDALRNIYVKID